MSFAQGRGLAALLLVLFASPLAAQPVITGLQPADGSLLAARSGTLSGQAAGATLLRVDGVELTLGSGGSFSYAFDLPEGESALSIYAEDENGATSQVHHLEVDTLAPGIVVSSPAQTRVGSSPVLVAGTVQEPHLQSVTVRGSPASLAGNSFSSSVTLSEGAQNIAIVATDTLGHSSTVTLVLTLDTQAPSISVSESGANFTGGLFDHPLTPQITITDAGTYTSEILLDGAPYASGTQIGQEGSHQLSINATDAVGNASSRDISFTLDFTAPVFGQITPAAGALIAQPTVTLQVEATGATSVRVGSLTGSAVGNFYTIGPITLTEGSQELVIEAFDAVGNGAERRHLLVRDTTAPTLSIAAPAEGAVLTSSPVVVSGQALDPRLASVRVGGELASLAGSTFSISKALVEGSNAFLVEALDSAGNSATQTLNLTLDTTAPSFVVKVNGVVLAGGEVFSAAITPTIELSEPSATVSATLDGASFTFGSAISSDGNHQLAVTVTHNSLSSSNLFSFRIDRQAPSFTSLEPAEGTVLAATSVLLEGRVQGAVSLTIDGVPVALQGEVFTAGPYTLSAGSRTFVLVATSAGGLQTTTSRTLVQDSVPPQLVVQQPAEGALLGSATTAVSGTATDPHLLRVRVSGVDAQVSASSFYASGVSLAEGSNTLTILAEDRAGNQQQATRTVVRDTLDPEVAITDPVAGTVVPAASYVVRGTASDAHLDRVEVNGRRATLEGGDFSLSINLVEGANTIEVVAFDRLGHSKTTTVGISRDSAAPQITIQDPPEGFSTQVASITVRGAYEDEPGTTVKVNGLVAVLTSGHFEVAGIELLPGENRITARATDAQGNEGVHTRTVVRDQVAPTFVRLEPAAGALALPLAGVFTLTFSEEMAPPAEGAITLATAGGSQLAFTAAVQGKDVVLTPQALLPPETTLVLSLHVGLVDLAGNALSPVPASFELKTVDTGAPGAPVLSTVPVAAACRHEVELTGTAEPLAQVRVQGGAAAALTRADEAGAFTLTVELLPEQLNVLHVVAIDALGNVSPELLLELAADCTPPQVLGATLTGDTVSVTFSEDVDASAGSFALISPNGLETFAFTTSGTTATLTLSAAPSGLLELAVGEGASTGISDLAGNVMAYPWHHLFGAGAGDSFLAGTVFDDGKGQPLRGVLVSVTSTNGVGLSDPLPQQTTGDDGRFLLGLPVGTHDVTFARPGYTPVFRVVTTAAGEGTHVFDPRLTLLNLPQAIGSAGGEVVAGEARLLIPAGALSSSQATSLTELSEQALPALLPYGYSPRGAVYVGIDASFASPATLELPVETLIGREVVIASLDFALLQWKALEVRTVSGPTLDIAISAPGAYVAVEVDSESAAQLVPVLGQVLPSLPAPAGDEVTAAAIDFAPTLVLPSQRSLATVSYTLANAGTPAPSGMPLTLSVQERLTLLDGSERRAVPYSADLLVFRSPAGSARSRFWLQPSPLAASLPIELGAEDVSIRTFGATTVRGNILGPDGGSVLGVSGDVFEVPAGALSQPTAVVVTRRSVADLSHPAPAGFPVLGVIEVDLGGAQLAGIGSLTLATETPPTAGSRGILLGTVEVDGEPRWRALAELEPVAAGWRTVGSGGSNPPWPGIRQGGLYLALELEGDWGLLEGELYDSDQNLVAGGLISSVAVPWIQLSASNGSYVIPLPAGTAVVVAARDLRYDQVAVEIPALTDGERRVFDLEVLPTGPTVIEIEPADGAANVPTTFLPRVKFSEPVDRSTLAAGIRLTKGGEPVAIDLDHQGDLVLVDPVASLLPDTSYTLEVGGTISDLQGRNLVGTRSVSFRTQLGEPPVPGIDASKLLLYEPDYQGLAKIIGLPGAVPADSTLWVESAETITVVAEANGSFELEIPATLGEDLFLTVLMPGQSAATRLLSPWLLRGDLGAWVGRSGARFKTAAGIEVEVQRDSFEQLTKVKLELEAPPIATPSQLQIVLDFDLDLGGATSLKPIYIRLPAPANVPAGSTFLVSRFVEALGRRGWMAMDLLEIQGTTLTNAPLSTVQGSVVARAVGVSATRYENPLERVLTADNMVGLRQGDYLPKASGQLQPDQEAFAPRGRLEAAPSRTEAQDIGLPALKTGGHLQVTYAVESITWLVIERGVADLMASIRDGFMAITPFANALRLLLPILDNNHPFEIAVYDLTTGYQVYRQVQPPTPDRIFVLPPGNYADNQPPSLLEGSPLRFALLQTAGDGSLEILNGISATVLNNSLTITGQPGSASPGAEVKLFDIDAANGASGIQDKVVRASEQGDFTLTISDAAPKRFLLAIGGVVGASERLKLRFSKQVASVEGIELHKVDESGKVNAAPTAIASSQVDQGATWQITPVTGWRAGKYELWITNQFGGPEPAQFWKRKLTLELEVPKSSSAGSIPLTRFSDFDRMGNVLAVADNDGGLRLFDVSNPASPQPFLSGPEPYHFSGGGAIRGVTIDNHGRVIVVGSGEQFPGQLHVLDPLVMDRQAPEATAWANGVWGYTTITNPLGVSYPFAKSGLPRSIAVMNNDEVNRWQVGSAIPTGITATSVAIPDSDEKSLELSGKGEVVGGPVSVRNLTRGRWSRAYADANKDFTVGVKVREGDLIELRRARNTWAYVSIDGKGIAMVDVEGTQGGAGTEAESLSLVEYTNGFHLQASSCDDSRPDVDSTPIDLDVAVSELGTNLVSTTLVTLVQGYGLALYQIDQEHPGNLSELSSACAAVDNRALLAGMEVVADYPMDLDGDGRIREQNETSPGGEVLLKEIRNYVVVAHSRGYVLIFDITNPASPNLVSRIKIGKSNEFVQISGVAVDRVNRKIYVGAFGRGLFAVDFNILGGEDLQDSDDDQIDDRVVENIQVGTEELVDALVFPDLGIIWGGGRKTGAWSVAVGGPKLKLIAADNGPIREVSRLAPLGVPTAHEGGNTDNPNYPAAFQAQVTVGSSIPELFVEVKSLGAGGVAIESAGDEEGIPKVELVDADAVKLERQASNPWEEGSTLYLSKPVVTIADVRAAIAYQKTEDENAACPRCDQVAEHLYPTQPQPADLLPELLSGHRVSVNFRPDILPGLRAVYGNLADGGISVPSVPWAMSPAVKQEPPMNASTGQGDVFPGTLLHSGEFSHGTTDFAIPGLGFDFVFSRTYRSQTIGNGPLGPGWDHGWNIHLRVLPNRDVELYDGRGRRDLVFTEDSAKYEKLKPGVAVMPHSQGFTMTDTAGNQSRFDLEGRLLAVIDPLKTARGESGSEVIFSYDVASKLTQIESHGRRIRISYENGRIESIIDFTNREWNYIYDSSGRLVQVNTPPVDLGTGAVNPLSTTYSYIAPPEAGGLSQKLARRDDLEKITNAAGEKIVGLEYETVPSGVRTRVKRELMGSGTKGVELTFDGTRTSVKDRREFIRHYDHDTFGHLKKATDPLGNATEWSFTDFPAGLRNGLIAEIKQPSKISTTYLYDEEAGSAPNLRRLAFLRSVYVSQEPFELGPGSGENPQDQHPLCKRFRPYESITLLELDELHGLTGGPGKIKDKDGNTTVVERDEAGIVKKATIDQGGPPVVIEQQTNQYGKLTEVKTHENDEAPRTVTSSATYDEQTGELLSRSVLVGGEPQTTKFERNLRGELTKLEEPGGLVTTRELNELDWVLRECLDIEGRPVCTSYQYDKAGRVVEIGSPFGTGEELRTKFKYGTFGELLEADQEIAPQKWVKRFLTYDENLNVVEIDGQGQAKKTFTYDERNLVKSLTETNGGEVPLTTNFSYDEDGRLIQTTSGSRNWKRTYDAIGRLAWTEDPSGNFTYFHYDGASRVVHTAVCREDEDAQSKLSETTFEYDSGGRLVKEIRDTGDGVGSSLVIAYGYDSRSRVVAVKDAANGIAQYRYDELGRVIREVLPFVDGAEIQYSYEQGGRLVSKTASANGATVTSKAEYNSLGLLAKSTIGTAATGIESTAFEYDDAGNLRHVIMPDGTAFSYSFDGLGRPLSVVRPTGIEETISYQDQEDSLTVTYKDALDQATVMEYGGAGELRSITFPDGTINTNGYDEYGNVSRIVRPDIEIHQEFDNLGRLMSRVRQAGEGPQVNETYSWDPFGRPIQATVGSQTTAWTWDLTSRPKGETQGSRSLTYAPHPTRGAGATQYPSGTLIEREYNDAGMLTSVRSDTNLLASFVQEGSVLAHAQIGPLIGDFAYDPRGRRAQSHWSGQSAALNEALSFDVKGLPVQKHRIDLGQKWDYSYDEPGQLKSAELSGSPSELSGKFEYFYDTARNLTRADRISACGSTISQFPLDGSGRNRPSNSGGTELTWDARGRLASKGSLLFGYDDRDRLVKVERRLDSENSEVIASYSYDIRGRRVERSVAGVSRTTVWDGWQAIEDYEGEVLVGQRVFGQGFDEILRLDLPLVAGGLSTYYPVYDSLGNIAALVRPNGELVERYDYGPYGGRIVIANDHRAPELEQIRLEGGVLRLQLSESSVREVPVSELTLQNLSKSEQPVLATQAVSAGGRQYGRQLAFKNGGNPNAVPPTWPEPGDEVRLEIAAGAFEDSFGNASPEYTFESLVWPGEDGVLVDEVQPRLEEICAQGSTLRISFSEPVSSISAQTVVQVDNQPVPWIVGNGGYTLSFTFAEGSHSISLNTNPLDLAGLGFTAPVNQDFSTDSTTRSVFEVPLPGVSGDSVVGNPYGFQGLAQDSETGFLYMRSRFYDPGMGRFITPDPMGYADGPNMYQFALNNPIVNHDPTGESAVLTGGVAGGLAGIAYAGYRSIAHGERFNPNYVVQGVLIGAAVGYGVQTLGAGGGVAASVIAGGAALGAGIGGAVGSVSGEGSYYEFLKGAGKGLALGAVSSAVGEGLIARGVAGGWAYFGSVAADTYAGVGADYAFGDCTALSQCAFDNALLSSLGNGLGFGLARVSRIHRINTRFSEISERVDGNGITIFSNDIADRKNFEVLRGHLIEPSNFPVIDAYDLVTGVGTSNKTLDLWSKTASDLSRFRSTIRRYVQKLSAFNGNITRYSRRTDATFIVGAVEGRVLELGVQADQLSLIQKQVLNQEAEAAARLPSPVVLRVFEIF